MCQMKSRARNIVENIVVVKYDAKIDGPQIPLDVDLEALQNQEMNMVINQRRVMTSFMNAYDREFYGTISKVGAGRKAKYFTNVLTDIVYGCGSASKNTSREDTGCDISSIY